MKIDSGQSQIALYQQQMNTLADPSTTNEVTKADATEVKKTESEEATPAAIVTLSGEDSNAAPVTYGFGGSNQKPPP